MLTCVRRGVSSRGGYSESVARNSLEEGERHRIGKKSLVANQVQSKATGERRGKTCMMIDVAAILAKEVG